MSARVSTSTWARCRPSIITSNPIHIPHGTWSDNPVVGTNPKTVKNTWVQMCFKLSAYNSINLAALDHARMIVELISLCETPREFISRVFARIRRTASALVAMAPGAVARLTVRAEPGNTASWLIAAMK